MKEDSLQGKRYICLVRASDPTQAESSTKAQLAMLHDHARNHGMVYVDEVVLEGVTGSLPGRRTDLASLLERKRTANDFDVLVLQRIDRLTRSGADHGFWFEHECTCAGIRLLFVGDDIPEGRYATLIKVAKYEAAQEQAFSISQRSTQGSQLALEQGRNVTSTHTPYACWRLYLNADGKPGHIIRDLHDGLQQKLHPETHAVIDTYGHIGGGSRGHYRKQKTERVLLMPGDPDKAEVVREIFRRHYVEGWGGKRIADLLNRRGIPSPQGRTWSQRQVEVIYEQEVYTGRSVGNRTSSAIYHRRSAKAPKPVDLDPTLHATAVHLPARRRPQTEWFIQDQPLMADFLEEPVRKLAMAAHEQLWRKRGDPTCPKVHRNQHAASDYLLSGLLVAKQDGGKMVGVLCGRVGKKVRYYRHRRGRRGYRKGSVYNRMLQAEPLEKAVIGVLEQVLADDRQIEERIRRFAVQQAGTATDQTQVLENLRARRDAVRRKTELIVSTLDEATLADASGELQRLAIERRTLEEQIVAAEAVARTSVLDPQIVVERVMAMLAWLSAHLKVLPNVQLREVLGLLVKRLEVDLATKQVTIELLLPSWAIWAAVEQDDPMRPLHGSASSSSWQTHPGVVLGIADCVYVKGPTKVCHQCRRRLLAA